jgi:glycosyltransferase involved in cell wall biosynthesis
MDLKKRKKSSLPPQCAGSSPRKLRILLWYWGRRGGGARMLYQMIEALSDRHDVVLDASISSRNELRDEITRLFPAADVVPLYNTIPDFIMDTMRIPRLANTLINRAVSFEADAIVSVMSHVWAPIIAPLIRHAGIPYFPIIHDASPHPGDNGFLWKIRSLMELKASTSAFALSDVVKWEIEARHPNLEVNRLILPSLITRKNTATPKYAINEAEDFTFLFCGRIKPYKGLNLLKEAFSLVRRQMPSARLHIAGEGNLEEVAPGISQMPGVTTDVRWVLDEEMESIIQRADAVVLPYVEASQSGILPSALAMGVPVIATPIGGLIEQATNPGVALSSEASPTSFALAMLAAMDPVTRKMMRKSASKYDADMEWKNHANELISGIRSAKMKFSP